MFKKQNKQIQKGFLALGIFGSSFTQIAAQSQGQLETMLLTNQTDSIFYYKPDGTKNWWYIQKDVFLYKKTNNSAHNGNNGQGVVDEVKYWQNEARKFNELKINGNASLAQKITLLTQIKNNNQFDIFSIAITKNKNIPYTENEYYKTDDLVLLTFRDPKVPQSQINYIMNKYKLELYHAPSPLLDNSVSWSYTFRALSAKNDPKIAFEIAKQIFEQDAEIIKISEPNIYGGSTTNCSHNELNPQIGGSGEILGTWYAKNNGGVIWNGLSGTNDADADVCECWGEGYTGKDIKVGVIDLGGFEFNHPDLATMDHVWKLNTTPSPTLFVTNVYSPNINGIIDGHGMQVAGIIGATANNRVGNNQKVAIGTAYDAKIFGYLMNSINSNEIKIGLQKAIEDNVDIINMSFKLEYSAIVENEINNNVQVGRPLVNDANYGIIHIAGSGNDDGVFSHFPANLPNVIGVGGSDPNDRRSSYFSDYESWSTNAAANSSGSSYGPPSYNYDVVAPFDIILTTDLVGDNGLQGDYTVTLGTSFSSPIVAGIAAILLEKNPHQYFNQIRQNIRDGAEKVRPELYNYNQYSSNPGYNDQMFYGRVSCINSLNLLNVTDVKEIEKLTTLAVHQKAETLFELFLPTSKKFNQFEVVSILGQKVISSQVNNKIQSIEIDLKNQANGMYFINLKDNEKIIGTVKIIR